MKLPLTGAALLLALFTSSASAAIVTYEYSVKIEYMYEGSLIQPLHAVNSTLVAGEKMSIGDTMSGFLSYDSNFTSIYQGNNLGTNTSYGTDVIARMSSGAQVPRHASAPAMVGFVSLKDNAGFYGEDVFSITSYSHTHPWEKQGSFVYMSWHDDSGKALDNTLLPAKALNWLDFNRGQISYYYSDGAGNEVSATGLLTKKIAEVPEPGSIFLLLGGLGMLGFGLAHRSETHS